MRREGEETKERKMHNNDDDDKDDGPAAAAAVESIDISKVTQDSRREQPHHGGHDGGLAHATAASSHPAVLLNPSKKPGEGNEERVEGDEGVSFGLWIREESLLIFWFNT